MSDHKEELQKTSTQKGSQSVSSSLGGSNPGGNSGGHNKPASLIPPAYTNKSSESKEKESNDPQVETYLEKDFSINHITKQALKEHGARAFTQDNKMFLSNDFNPSNIEDQALFNHEFTHLIQNDFSNSNQEENAKNEAAADSKIVQFNEAQIRRIILEKRANKAIGNSPIQRKPDPFTPTHQEMDLVKNYKAPPLDPKEYDSFREQLKKDVTAKILENISKTEQNLQEQLQNIPQVVKNLQVDASIIQQLRENQEELKKIEVGFTNRFNPHRVNNTFLSGVPPLYPFYDKGSNVSRYDKLNKMHNNMEANIDKIADKNPILYAAVKSQLGSIDKLLSHKKEVAQTEARKIINQMTDACQQTRANAIANKLKYSDFKPVIEQLKNGAYSDRKDQVDHILKIDARKEAFWNYGKFGLEIILAIGAAYFSGGLSIAATGTGVTIGAVDATKSIIKYDAMSDAKDAASSKDTQIVDENDVKASKADMILNVGGFLVGYKDGIEVFKYVRNETNISIIRASAKIAIETLDSPESFRRFIIQNGGWKNAAKKIEGNTEVAQKMKEYRDLEYEKMKKVVEAHGSKISRTGNKDSVTNDLDASVLGPLSFDSRQKVFAWMKKEYQVNSNEECLKLFDMGLFGDSKLKYGYQALDSEFSEIVKKNVAITENGAILNRLLGKAKKSGNEEKVRYYRNLLETGGFKEYEFKSLSPKELDIVNKDIDRLYKEFLASKDPEQSAKIMTELQEKLTIVDISDEAAYHTGAGVFKMNAFRKVNEQADFLWKAVKENNPLDYIEKQQLFMGQFSAYSHALAKISDDILDSTAIRSIGKYGQRITPLLQTKKSKGKVRRMRKRFKYIFQVGSELEQGTALEVALKKGKYDGFKCESVEEFQLLIKECIVSVDNKIQPRINKILSENKQTLKEGGAKGLKPTQAQTAHEDVNKFVEYVQSRDRIDFLNTQLKSQAKKYLAKKVVNFLVGVKSDKPKKKSKKEKPARKEAPVTQTVNKQDESKKPKAKKSIQTNQVLKNISITANSSAASAYSESYGLALRLSKKGKMAKPKSNIHQLFKKDLLRFKNSPSSQLASSLEKKCDYMENLLLTYYKGEGNRRLINHIFSMIKANVWNMLKQKASNMVSPSVKSKAKGVQETFNNTKKSIGSTIDKATKPIQNLGDSILEAGESVVDMATPDFLKSDD